jgi:hypothetical protein
MKKLVQHKAARVCMIPFARKSDLEQAPVSPGCEQSVPTILFQEVKPVT